MARLVYIDETGSDGVHSTRHPLLTVAAVLVPETKVMDLHDAMRKLTWAHLGWLPSDFEFHGEELWGGGGHWKGKSYEELMAAYEAAIGLLDELDLFVSWASIYKEGLHRRHGGGADANAYPLALQFLLEKIDRVPDGYLQLVIADEAKEHELKAVRMVADMQHLGLGEVAGRTLTSVIDSLHFARSHDSPGVQMADLVAYVLQRWWSRRDQHPAARASMERMVAVVSRRARTWREPWPPGSPPSRF